MSRLLSVFEPLDKAADAVIDESGRGSILVKQDVLDSLSDGVGFLGNAVAVMGDDLADAGYGPEIYAPAHRAADALHSGARACGDAIGTLDSLLKMTISELAASQRQAPNHTELNGSH